MNTLTTIIPNVTLPFVQVATPKPNQIRLKLSVKLLLLINNTFLVIQTTIILQICQRRDMIFRLQGLGFKSNLC